MANKQVNLALANGYGADGISTIDSLKSIPFLDTEGSWVDNNVNGRTLSYDNYQFQTDWNGSTNYLRVRAKDIFSIYDTQGLHLDTTDTIGKDRRLIIQYLDTSKNLFPPNVIGYTGYWKNSRRDFHPRLDMVCFHYMDENGVRTFDYLVDRPLYDHSSTNHTWRYGSAGQHDSGSIWRIGYTINKDRYSAVVNQKRYLCGMTLDIKFRTAAGQHTCDGRFWHWKPIVSTNTSVPSLSTGINTLTTGDRLVIPASGTWPVSGDMKLTS